MSLIYETTITATITLPITHRQACAFMDALGDAAKAVVEREGIPPVGALHMTAKYGDVHVDQA